MTDTNTYSDTWFRLFMDTIPPEKTEKEVAFLTRVLPQPEFRSILDVCCGTGRHALALNRAGYAITGVDASNRAIEEARRRAAGRTASFLPLDMRDLVQLTSAHDAVICLWQSFGQFGAEENHEVLRGFRRVLRPGGRLVLDIYHRGFFERRLGRSERLVQERRVIEEKHMEGDRLVVTLRYGREPGSADRFEWQIFTPEEIEALASTAGLHLVRACSGFDEESAPSPDVPRMQLVFE